MKLQWDPHRNSKTEAFSWFPLLKRKKSIFCSLPLPSLGSEMQSGQMDRQMNTLCVSRFTYRPSAYGQIF